MSGFIEHLESLSEKDTKVRAVLRRSLAFDPGDCVPAFPYVEPFVKGEENPRRREVFYLVAGLWASHWREGRNGSPQSLGKACAAYQVANGSGSTERRFIALLDADHDQLPHHLRQMISLLKDQPLDFGDLLKRLLYWHDERKNSQLAWAREYYQNRSEESITHPHSEKETNQ